MRLTQGTFSFLPDLTGPEIHAQVEYGLRKGWAWSVEYTDDPHPRNTYWEMWCLPMFDLHDAAGVLYEVNSCRKAQGANYIRLVAFFFSSRRRHTRSLRDWSSDVCSSDLPRGWSCRRARSGCRGRRSCR